MREGKGDCKEDTTTLVGDKVVENKTGEFIKSIIIEKN